MTDLSLVHIIEAYPCFRRPAPQTCDRALGWLLHLFGPEQMTWQRQNVTRHRCLTKQLIRNEDGQSWPHEYNGNTMNC